MAGGIEALGELTVPVRRGLDSRETPPILERGAELGAFDEILARSGGGVGGIAFVEAATGLGKSRLLDEAAALAAGKGHQLFAARARHLERDVPFGVVRQLFEKTMASLEEEAREQLLAGSAALAAPLLSGQLPTSAGISASLHGLYWLTANFADERPVLVIVDDLQWCDLPTLRFLLYLAQRVDELHVTVALGVAEGSASGADALLDELRSHPATTIVRPQPLSEKAVGQTLGGLLSSAPERPFTRACFDATGGNPLLVRELAAELALRELQPRATNAALVRELAPESIAVDVLVRLRRLDEGAPELARAIAVIGEEVDLRHAATVAGMPVERAAQLADALMERGLLRRDQRLSFVHPVVALAVYNDRPEFDRAEAHRKAAELLIADGAPAERVIPHLLAGRPAGDAHAVEVLMQAAESALLGGAPQSAIRLLRRALEEPPPVERRPDVLVVLGRAEGAAGAPEAIEHLTGAIELIGDPAARAAAALDTGRVLIAHGRWEDAASTLRHGIEDIGESDPQLRARLEVGIAMVGQATGIGDCPEWALSGDAPGLEEEPAGRLLLARAAANEALRGTSAERVRSLAVRALANGALIDSETADGLGIHLAVFALATAEDLQTSELAATTAIEDARKRGSVLGFATSSFFRSLAQLQRGRVADAAADALGSLAATRYGWGLAPSGAASVVAEVALEEGDLVEARRALDAHPRDAATALPLDYRYFGVRGRLRLAEAEPAQALDDLVDAGRLLNELGGDNPAVYPWRTFASAAHLALGDRAEARRLAEEEVELAAAFGAPGAHGRALGALAATVTGAATIAVLEEAVRVLDVSAAALERARALAELGAARRRAGRRRLAEEPLRLALDLAGRCGGRLVVKRAKDELIVLGARPRRSAASGLESLTAREAQVAGLAAQGQPNREIAESLFITVKTVEWHLRHAYEKLGVRSRRDLGRALAGRDVSEGQA